MPREEAYENMPYDEALEFSGSDMSVEDQAEAKMESRISSDQAKESREKETIMMNDQYDEAHELESEASVDTTDERLQKSMTMKKEEVGHDQAPAKTYNSPTPDHKIASPAGLSVGRSESDESEDEDEDESADPRLSGSVPTKAPPAGGYDANDYKDLKVSAEVNDLFQYIARYNAQEVELDSTLRCFVPDYIPAVGEMDPFIKVPRPDGEADNLGLIVLDEAAAAQSDATVLELQLRAVSKKQHGDLAVRSIEDAAKNPIEIERWMNSIAELHRSKPQAQVNFRKPMPDIDVLMQEWSPEVEEVIASLDLMKNTNFADIDTTLPDFIRTACALIDIPVYDNLVESLHILFSLYLEFVENPHFSAQRRGGLSPQQAALSDDEYRGGHSLADEAEAKHRDRIDEEDDDYKAF